jgi:hypothetical protein
MIRNGLDDLHAARRAPAHSCEDDGSILIEVAKLNLVSGFHMDVVRATVLEDPVVDHWVVVSFNANACGTSTLVGNEDLALEFGLGPSVLGSFAA